jgi:hypothetical protein
MFTTSDILEKIYQNWWGIVLYLGVLCILYNIYRLITRLEEGFSSGNIPIQEGFKPHACQGIKLSMEANKKLVERYEAAQAVGSLADVKEVIKIFSAKWLELDCDTILENNPIPVVHLPNMEDLTAEITKTVTAKINAEIEAKKAEAEAKKAETKSEPPAPP